MCPLTPSGDIETFPNPQTERDYTIRMRLPEFTCLCPLTGQPDFAVLDLEWDSPPPLHADDFGYYIAVIRPAIMARAREYTETVGATLVVQL